MVARDLLLKDRKATFGGVGVSVAVNVFFLAVLYGLVACIVASVLAIGMPSSVIK